jgi:hypothetical protein
MAAGQFIYVDLKCSSCSNRWTVVIGNEQQAKDFWDKPNEPLKRCPICGKAGEPADA